MVCPLDDYGQSSRPSEKGSGCESISDRPLLCKSVLRDIFETTVGRNSPDLYPGALHLLDRVCEETKFGLADEPFSLEGLTEDLTCRRREGSFDLNPSTVALCVHLVNVICLSSFLIYLRIEEEDGDAAVEMPPVLSSERLRQSDKWKLWGGESCKNTLKKWKSFASGADCEKNEVMRLLYHWTYPSLHRTFSSRNCELEKVSQSQGSEIERLIECGDELCHFLDAYKSVV